MTISSGSPQPSNLKEARLLAGKNKSQLARESGVSWNTIHRIEESMLKKEPRANTCGGIAEALNMNPMEVLELCIKSIEEG